MSTLTSASTLTEVLAAYDDNASYFEDDSVSKARAFVTACRILLRRLSYQANHGSVGLRIETPRIETELRAAERFLAAHPSAGGAAVGFSLENFR